MKNKNKIIVFGNGSFKKEFIESYNNMGYSIRKYPKYDSEFEFKENKAYPKDNMFSKGYFGNGKELIDLGNSDYETIVNTFTNLKILGIKKESIKAFGFIGGEVKPFIKHIIKNKSFKDYHFDSLKIFKGLEVFYKI